MNTYWVIEKRCGSEIGRSKVKADDALSAIAKIEAMYGEPPRVSWSKDKDGKLRMICSKWHGCEFEARLVV